MEKLISTTLALIVAGIILYYLYDASRRFWAKRHELTKPRSWQTLAVVVISIFYGIAWIWAGLPFVLDPFLMAPFLFAVIAFTFATSIFMRSKTVYVVGTAYLLVLIFRNVVLEGNFGPNEFPWTILKIVLVILLIWDFRSFFPIKTQIAH